MILPEFALRQRPTLGLERHRLRRPGSGLHEQAMAYDLAQLRKRETGLWATIRPQNMRKWNPSCAASALQRSFDRSNELEVNDDRLNAVSLYHTCD